MKYLYWFIAVLVIALGVYFSTQLSVAPQSVTKIKYQQMESPESFGQMTFSYFKERLKNEPILFLGVTPNQMQDLELWRAFLDSIDEKESKYDLIIVEAQLPYVEIFETGVHIQIKEDMTRLVEGISKARSQGLRVAVIAPTIYTSQLLKDNPFFRLNNEFKMDGLSLSLLQFPVSHEQEASFEPKCFDGGAVDPAGISSLACMIRNIARKTYKNKSPKGKFSGMLEQITEKDYLLLFNRN